MDPAHAYTAFAIASELPQGRPRREPSRIAPDGAVATQTVYGQHDRDQARPSAANHHAGVRSGIGT